MERNRTVPPHRIRFAGFILFLLLITGAVVAKYAILMLKPGQTIKPKAALTADRGQILDRNGRILAIQTRFGNVTVWRPQTGDLDTLATVLSPVLGMNETEIINRIRLSATDFIYLKKQVDQDVVRKIDELATAGTIDGVSIEPVLGRMYPEGTLAAQIIGFTGDENTGLAGIEYVFDGELRSKDGGTPGFPGGMAGNQVVLTIDTTIQYLLEEIAEKTLVENQAEAVMLLAIEPRSGEILGAATRPGFDPNFFKESSEQARMIRPAVWAYEPGSVFKVFSLAAIMDAEAINPQSTFYCNGSYEHTTNLGERIVINCLGAHGTVDPRRIITYSCNAGAAYASDVISRAMFYDGIRRLGFGEKTGSALPGETAGFLRPPERWSERTKPTIAMGQEIAVSAFQMLQAATAIANDGVMVTPHIVLQIEDANGKALRKPDTPEPRRVLKPETARELRSYMTDVTSPIGTGYRAGIGDIQLAVKTGTAQVIDSATNRYSDTNFIASCIALLPSDEPALVLYIVIVNPKGSSYLGGRIAAPPIREAAEALVNYIGIPRGRNPTANHSGLIRLPSIQVPFISDVMPDLTGYSKRQLLPLLLRDDLRINVKGDGYVVRQNPAAGGAVGPDTVIYLELDSRTFERQPQSAGP
ncbi:MAG: transpeptidase family protein [Spirochaetaceae bacterium]|jgi:cell division protein FtsI (penicillin-binding protein 3)|nr:transpeptidase family protein [Spirochaetaceae bacterium]